MSKKNKDGFNLAHVACFENKLEILEFLYDIDMNIDEKSLNGTSPLLIGEQFFDCKGNYLISIFSLLLTAAQEGFNEIVEFLCKKNANINIEEINGFTPIFTGFFRTFQIFESKKINKPLIFNLSHSSS